MNISNNEKWLIKHASRYKGCFVALQNGNFKGWGVTKELLSLASGDEKYEPGYVVFKISSDNCLSWYVHSQRNVYHI